MMFNRARCCVFTVNNPTENDEEVLLDSVGDDKLVTYIIFGHEEGDGGTYHWQGYAQFSKALTLNQVKKFLPRAHIESVKGTQKQAIDYCKKDGHFDEYGTLKTHGGQKANKNKEKYAEIKKKIISDKVSLRSVVLDDCDNTAQVKFAEIMEKYGGLEENTRNVKIFWYYGATGCGKSHSAFAQVNRKNYWKASENLKWFDGYCGQEDVIIDDFRSGHCTFAFLLQVLDIYPLQVPVKGGFVRWSPKRIFITSPFHPKDCYKNIEDKSQLIRRITEIKHFMFRYNADGSSQPVDDDPNENVMDTNVPTLENDGYEATYDNNFPDGDVF